VNSRFRVGIFLLKNRATAASMIRRPRNPMCSADWVTRKTISQLLNSRSTAPSTASHTAFSPHALGKLGGPHQAQGFDRNALGMVHSLFRTVHSAKAHSAFGSWRVFHHTKYYVVSLPHVVLIENGKTMLLPHVTCASEARSLPRIVHQYLFRMLDCHIARNPALLTI
jgi:hypothetical protein